VCFREKYSVAEDEIGLNCLGTVEILICSPRFLDQGLICPERQQLNKVYYKRNENTTANGELLDNHDFRCRECTGVGGGAEGLWAEFWGRLRDGIRFRRLRPGRRQGPFPFPWAGAVDRVRFRVRNGVWGCGGIRGPWGCRTAVPALGRGHRIRPRTRPTAPVNRPCQRSRTRSTDGVAAADSGHGLPTWSRKAGWVTVHARPGISHSSAHYSGRPVPWFMISTYPA
jgi:hypothetical protein